MAPLAKPSLLAIHRFMVDDGSAAGTKRVHTAVSGDARVQTHELEHFSACALGIREAEDERAVHEVLEGVEPAVDRGSLHEHAHARVGRTRSEPPPEHAHRARVLPHEARNQLEQRGLAGPVLAHEAEHGAGRHGEAHVLHRAHRAVAKGLAEAAGLDCVCHGASFPELLSAYPEGVG